MSFSGAKLFQLIIKPTFGRKRNVRVLADDKRMAEMAACLKPFEEVVESRELKGVERFFEDLFVRAPKESDFAACFEKIARLLRVKIPLEKAFRLQMPLLKKRTSRYVMLKIIEAFSLGKGMAEAFGEHPEVFSPTFLAMLKGAQKSDDVEAALVKIGHANSKRDRVLKKLKGEMIYPACVFSLSIVVAIVLTYKFLPQLSETYKTLDAELPAITKYLFRFSSLFIQYPFLVLVPVGIVALIVKKWKRIQNGVSFQWVVGRIPRLGPFLWQQQVVVVLDHIALGMAAGMPLEESLEVARQIASNRRMKKILLSVKENVAKGESLSLAFVRESPLLGKDGDEIVSTIEVGEQTGDLEKVMEFLTRSLSEELDFQVENFKKILNPMVTIVMTVFGGAFVLAILWPIIKLTTLVIENIQ